MRKETTLDEILDDRAFFSENQARKIKETAAKEIKSYWGGKRAGAGRKLSGTEVLCKHMRVSESEQKAIHLVRKMNLNLTPQDLKFLSFAKENKLSLRSLMRAA